MKRAITGFLIFLSSIIAVYAQEEDSLNNERLSKMINLSDVMVRSGVNVARFIQQVKEDTTFYKAFRTLHILGFDAWNSISIRDKKGNVKASLQSRTRQIRQNGCRSMNVLQQFSTGDFFNSDSSFNYYTANLYAGLFFTSGKVCGENNIVKGIDFSPKGESGMEKRKQQLKMLFFNPGKKIPGIPFIGDKIDIFDPEKAKYYDFLIDYGEYEGDICYVFSIRVRNDLSGGERNKIVIDSMTTWFNIKTMEVMARNYDMSYNAGVYDFDVHMEVQMTRYRHYLVPKLIRYIGDWDVAFKKRERGYFTANLFDFTD